MANVVVIGGGLGGLPTAYELRHYLPKKHTVTLISDKPQFTFIPGLIRVALNLNPLEPFGNGTGRQNCCGNQSD